MRMTRREMVSASAAIAGVLAASGEASAAPRARRYHLCLSEDAIETDPGLLPLVRQAGVTDVWVTGFLYGYWHYAPERVRRAMDAVEAAGMAAHVVNVPLGHPGDSLGAMAGDVPLTPPKHWRTGVGPGGETYPGTSLHDPATAENAAALRRLSDLGARQVFLDDDFRLARSPGIVGGCFCEAHRAAFLRRGGYAPARWDELLNDVRAHQLTPLLRAWVDSACDELTACFRAVQRAAPDTRLGIMVMYMGAEKAGIRLADYRGCLFRVGEGHFGDGDFGTVKGKTVELFSSLFHRRFARPDLAYSETTAYPAHALSARNMAAKLAVSTLSDVRNTCMMSGLTPFPRTHWQTLAPAMRKQAALHARVADRRPRGPWKHWWGEAGRYVSDDNPYSLFLACGVPFEVATRPPRDGVVFLSEYDGGEPLGERAIRVVRPSARTAPAGARVVPEALPDLFALKRSMAPALDAVPHVLEDTPAVCAWYPDARLCLLWNLEDRPVRLTLRHGAQRVPVSLAPLDTEAVDL